MSAAWPLLVHFCDVCRYNTPVPYSPTVWHAEHICSHVSLRPLITTKAVLPGETRLTYPLV